MFYDVKQNTFKSFLRLTKIDPLLCFYYDTNLEAKWTVIISKIFGKKKVKEKRGKNWKQNLDGQTNKVSYRSYVYEDRYENQRTLYNRHTKPTKKICS